MTLDSRLDEISLLCAKSAPLKEIIRAISAAAADEGSESYEIAIKQSCAKASAALLSMRNTGASAKEIMAEASAFIESACRARDAKSNLLNSLTPFMKYSVYGNEAPSGETEAAAAADSILNEFLSNQKYVLEEMEKYLLRCESKNGVDQALDELKRIIHTVKGEAGMLGLNEVSELCHLMEDFIIECRKNSTGCDVQPMFAAKDALAALYLFHSGKGLKKPDTAAAKDMLKNAFARQETKPSKSFVEELLGDEFDAIKQEFLNQAAFTLEDIEKHILQLEHDRSQDKVASLKRLIHTMKGESAAVSLEDISSACHTVEDYIITFGTSVEIDPLLKFKDFVNETALFHLGKRPQRPDFDALRKFYAQEQQKKGATEESIHARENEGNAGADSRLSDTLKVDSVKLDRLIDTIGELVIIEAMLREDLAASDNSHKHIRQLNKITRDLQDLGFGLRMVSLKSTFQKMSRLVRDLSKKSAKIIEFVTSGDDTEMDKGVVEKIGDPLVHILRNAVDHGMDTPEERMRRGKPATGKIELKAFHKAGSIFIEVSDDGNGLDRDKILKKACERGMCAEGAELSDQQVYSMIFQSGFSTAEKVTSVSGRGVGMDVVKRAIESLRGRIEISTQKHRGTKFTIILPLTLAIIEGMVVKTGTERHIIPTLSIMRSMRPEPGMVRNVLGKGEMLYERGTVMPVFRLSRLFNIEGAVNDPCEAILVIVEDKGETAAIMVDSLIQQQVVIKTLGELDIKGKGISGGAILADGRISVILDAGQVIALARGEAASADKMEKLTVIEKGGSDA